MPEKRNLPVDDPSFHALAHFATKIPSNSRHVSDPTREGVGKISSSTCGVEEGIAQSAGISAAPFQGLRALRDISDGDRRVPHAESSVAGGVCGYLMPMISRSGGRLERCRAQQRPLANLPFRPS